MRKTTIRPTINRFNKTLNKLLARGWNSYCENVSQRGDWCKLHKPRRRKEARA